MSRDGHDGSTKCQCCAQAKRQYEEVLREMEARFVRPAKTIEEMGSVKATKEKLLSTGLAIDAEKERYRLLTGRSICKTASEPESLQKAKQLQICPQKGSATLHEFMIGAIAGFGAGFNEFLDKAAGRFNRHCGRTGIAPEPRAGCRS